MPLLRSFSSTDNPCPTPFCPMAINPLLSLSGVKSVSLPYCNSLDTYQNSSERTFSFHFNECQNFSSLVSSSSTIQPNSFPTTRSQMELEISPCRISRDQTSSHCCWALSLSLQSDVETPILHAIFNKFRAKWKRVTDEMISPFLHSSGLSRCPLPILFGKFHRCDTLERCLNHRIGD